MCQKYIKIGYIRVPVSIYIPTNLDILWYIVAFNAKNLAMAKESAKENQSVPNAVNLTTTVMTVSTDCPLDFNRTAFTDFVPPCVMF